MRWMLLMVGLVGCALHEVESVPVADAGAEVAMAARRGQAPLGFNEPQWDSAQVMVDAGLPPPVDSVRPPPDLAPILPADAALARPDAEDAMVDVMPKADKSPCGGIPQWTPKPDGEYKPGDKVWNGDPPHVYQAKGDQPEPWPGPVGGRQVYEPGGPGPWQAVWRDLGPCSG